MKYPLHWSIPESRVSLNHSLTDNVMFTCFGHFSVVCESIYIFFTVLPLDREAISDGIAVGF